MKRKTIAMVYRNARGIYMAHSLSVVCIKAYCRLRQITLLKKKIQCLSYSNLNCISGASKLRTFGFYFKGNV